MKNNLGHNQDVSKIPPLSESLWSKTALKQVKPLTVNPFKPKK